MPTLSEIFDKRKILLYQNESLEYSNPMHVYREYIKNSTDSIDKAVADGVISSSEAAIHIQIDSAKQRIILASMVARWLALTNAVKTVQSSR